MSLLRNFGCRKLRTALTVLGITIGIWVLVVFSSMANKVNALVAGGSAFYAGKITTRIRARQIGFVFQQFNLVPTLTAAENVALAGEYAGMKRGAALAKAAEILEQVGLADRGGHQPSELSGGERQRVAIARALINEPALILADEPTGNLDSRRAAELLGLLRRFNQERGQTFVLVTHDAEVGEACDRIVRMRDGLVHETPVATAAVA